MNRIIEGKTYLGHNQALQLALPFFLLALASLFIADTASAVSCDPTYDPEAALRNP